MKGLSEQEILQHVIKQAQMLCQRSQLYIDFFSRAHLLSDDLEMTMDEISDYTGISRENCIYISKVLSQIGINWGRFIVGRRGGSSRIYWRFSPKKLAGVVLGAKGIDSVLSDNLSLAVMSDGLQDQNSSHLQPLTISAAKQRLALAFGVSPTAIEIIIRA